MSEKNEPKTPETESAAPADPFAGFVSESSHEEVSEETPVPEQGQKDEEAAKEDKKAPEKEPDGAKGKVVSKKTFDERVAAITAKRHEEARARTAAETRVAELEARLAALEGKKTQASDQLTQPAEGAKANPDAPDPEKFEYGEVDPRYVAALARYEAKQELAEDRRKNDEARQAEAAARKEQDIQQKLDAHIRKGVEAYDDFEAAYAALDAIETPVAPETAELLLKSDYAADMLYHLGKNIAEAAEVAKSSPIEQALYLGKLEARFAAEKGDKQEIKKPEPTVSKAPPPPETRARGSDGKFSVNDDTDDFAAFEAKYSKGG